QEIPMTDQKNTILAIALSALVLIAWQYFFGLPQMEKQKQIQQQQTQQQQPSQTQQTQQSPATGPGASPQKPAQVPAAGTTELSREDALAKSPQRARIDTPRLAGSIALTGGRIDDLSLRQYHETVDPNSPAIVLLSPSGSPHPFYAEFGWVPAA